MTRSEWRKVSVPEEMIKHLQDLIEKEKIRKKFGLQTVSEAVRFAIHDLITKLEKELEEV